MSAQEKLIDAINDVNLSQWDEVQAYMERQIADAILSSDWLAAHDAEKRAEWEAEQRETLTGEIRGLAFEDGEPHGIYCGLDECGCPDHDDPPRPAGTYITVRLDGEPPVGLWRVQVRRIPVPDTTNNESEDE